MTDTFTIKVRQEFVAGNLKGLTYDYEATYPISSKRRVVNQMADNVAMRKIIGVKGCGSPYIITEFTYA